MNAISIPPRFDTVGSSYGGWHRQPPLRFLSSGGLGGGFMSSVVDSFSHLSTKLVDATEFLFINYVGKERSIARRFSSDEWMTGSADDLWRDLMEGDPYKFTHSTARLTCFPIATVTEEVSVDDDLFADGLSQADRLRWIKESLAIGVSGLADLFGVTRKTVYDWLGGVSEPKRAQHGVKIAAFKSAIESSNLGERARLLKHVLGKSSGFEPSLMDFMRSDKREEKVRERILEILGKLEPTLMDCENSVKKPRKHDFGQAHIEDLIRSM